MMIDKKKLKSCGTGFVFILPNFAGFLVFTLLPVCAAFVLAFYKWDILTKPEFIGFANFSKLFADKEFWNSFYNTCVLMLGIPLSMAASLFLACMVNRSLRGIIVYRTLYFFPSICSGIGLLLLWRWIYNPDFGLLNTLLSYIGISGPDWLGSVFWAKPALIFMGIWTGMGGTNMILFLAALQGVNPELYEAADMDGAGSWKKFWHITLPMISPTTFFIFTMSIIGGFQGNFNTVYVMTGGGPAGSTTTLSFHIYRNAYELFNMGYASSMALVLFGIVFVATLINWRYGGKKVTY
jgi:multiple sugar transport system permease protein